jgi:methionyl-tRNA formyltransferase
MTSRLRVVFFGELGSTFSRLHYAVLRRRTDVLLWVAGRSNQNANERRQFVSIQDWWERLRIRTGLEWETLRALGTPAVVLNQVDVPIALSADHTSLFETLNRLEPDVIVSAGFTRILPAEILRVPKLGAFNCHPAPLPRYAGSNPWFWILRNGETESAVTIHRMVVEADAGPIVRQKRFQIASAINHQQLYNQSSLLSALLLRECVDRWARGIIDETPQDLLQRTFFSSPRKDDYRIDWSQSARQIQDLVRAASPLPGAWTTVGGQQFTVRGVEPMAGDAPAGIVVSVSRSSVSVGCADGLVRILRISLDRKEMSGGQFSGFPRFSVGQQLE